MSSQEKIMGAGKALYMLNVPNVEIARTLDVSETTVSNWVVKGSWREERASGLARKKSIQDRLLNLIDFQLEALEAVADGSRISNSITPLDKGEIDALAKLFAQIRGKELTWANVVSVIREFSSFINDKDNDLAKALITYADDFLMTKREVMTA